MIRKIQNRYVTTVAFNEVELQAITDEWNAWLRKHNIPATVFTLPKYITSKAKGLLK